MAKADNKETNPSGSPTKYIYEFGVKTDGNGQMKPLLGGKGANLAEMARIGLPVPPGFTITTEICTWFYEHARSYPASLDAGVREAVANVEQQVGRRFGDPKDPLLFSVRSGARESMPGMMDTILNLGLNDQAVLGLAEKTKNPRFAWDCYRRFINMYGDVVMGVQKRSENEHDPFDDMMDTLKKEKGVESDTQLDTEALQELVRRFKKLINERTGRDFPQDPYEQLWGAVGAVFESWNNERAIVYRQRYHIPAEWGTAVNIQTMVFGNKGDTSATGVAFTRDPANGNKVFYGEYLVNAQGEDVVAGIRTPKAIAKMAAEMPESHAELERVRQTLEKHFRDMQDFEFTIEEKKLYMLQTRNAKRTGLAAIRIAYDMVQEGLIDQRTAVQRIPADSISTLLAPTFDESARKTTKVLAKGLPAGPGAASGCICFSATHAEDMARQGKKAILCRIETTPEDLRGMIAADGILTTRGGVSSHAALVARQMGKVCVCGAMDVVIDYAQGTLAVGNTVAHRGDYISIDGTTGEIFLGQVATAPSEVSQVLEGSLGADKSATYLVFAAIMSWADNYRRLDVRANADNPRQAALAISLGAQGVGLCRTEHMFFEGDRIDAMREMILATTPAERAVALAKILPYQRDDFHGILKAMGGRPVTIRLLDPPLHEFVPHDSAARNALAEKLGISTEVIAERVNSLHEQNPMLGHRGCRLGITYPEITEMQARAVFEAAAMCEKEGVHVDVEVMVPLVGFEKELADQSAIIRSVADKVMGEQGVKFEYMVGSMIEVPRAALRAGSIAEQAQFFSFGTNDLTQTTLGMSRDDMGSFFPTYQMKEILGSNPFASIDVGGVGQLVTVAVASARAARPGIKLGICGEHGGDPMSIYFFEEAGLDYVSCSPPRVPVARLAAAQAALRQQAKQVAKA
jgi:pyruvate,orthophosphate dikinase